MSTDPTAPPPPSKDALLASLMGDSASDDSINKNNDDDDNNNDDDNNDATATAGGLFDDIPDDPSNETPPNVNRNRNVDVNAAPPNESTLLAGLVPALVNPVAAPVSAPVIFTQSQSDRMNRTTVPTTSTSNSVTIMQSSSLLQASGLLGDDTLEKEGSSNGNSNGSGGLFDDIDEQQELRLLEQQQEEASAAAAAKQEQERLQQEQQLLQDQMQSIHLASPPPQQYQQRQEHQQQHQQPTVYATQQQQQRPVYATQPYPQQQQQPVMYATQTQQPQTDFYRPRAPVAAVVQPAPNAYQQQQQQQFAPNNSNYPQYPSGQQQQHRLQPGGGSSSAGMNSTSSNGGGGNRYYQPAQRPLTSAGLHQSPASVQARIIYQPQPIANPIYSKVLVTEPMLVSSPTVFLMSQAPHWSYQVSTELSVPGSGTWLVRRRFRHVVALEDRLRLECPGAILPPRPDKHATRAIEEASAHQSAEFALQRAAELQVYLNQLIQHPVCFQSTAVRLFLALQDDLGTAWPECSNNALTRLTQASVGAAVKVSEQTSTTKLPWHGDMALDEYGEDNAELLAVQSSEAVRMGAVMAAVPKLEGAVTLLREQAEQTGAVGMELSRLAKEVEVTDQELGQPIAIVSSGMLRAGRRSKRMALELSAAMHTFSVQYKLCKYEKAAFGDRRVALVRRHKERGKADQRAAQLMIQQRQMYGLPYGQHQQQQQSYQQQYQQQPGMMPGSLDRLERDAAVMDDMATDADRDAQEMCARLTSEINRVAWQRRTEWNGAVKIVASAMKEAVTERVAIWESVRETFLQAFPEEDTGN